MTSKLQDLIAQRFGETVTLSPALDSVTELAAILNHRSHRDYKPTPVAADLLKLLCACALAAPSKSDLQQADIVHIADPGNRREIAALIPTMPWIGEAPVFLVFCANNRRIREICRLRGKPFANDHLDSFMNAAVDAGLALMNFIRAAESVGLGCCPISVIRNHAARVSELLKLPTYVFPVAGLCLGYPATREHISPRLALTTTLHTDRFDDSNLAAQIDAYDRRRAAVQPIDPDQQRYVDDYEQADFYGWSEDKARQTSKPERADFGAFIRAKGFKLD